MDYFLVTRGLLPWIKHGDIQPSLKGSDHCPIYIDLHDEITLESGEKVLLRDAMKQNTAPREAPRLAAKYWEEYSGKQTMLSSFFGKARPAKEEHLPQRQTPACPSRGPAVDDGIKEELSAISTSTSIPEAHAETSDPTKSIVSRVKVASKFPPSPKRKLSTAPSAANTSKKKKKSELGQATIASFFKKTPSSSQTQEVIDLADTDSDDATPLKPSTSSLANIDQLNADYRLACELSAADDVTPSNSFSSTSASASTSTPNQSKTAWTDLFAPLKPPNCTVHGEPTKLWTVNKPGPNKGKKFYLCSRYVIYLAAEFNAR